MLTHFFTPDARVLCVLYALVWGVRKRGDISTPVQQDGARVWLGKERVCIEMGMFLGGR